MNRVRNSLLIGAALVAAVAMAASAATLAGLGEAVGWHDPLHWSLPVSVDMLALVAGVAWLSGAVPDSARRLGCWLTVVSVAASVVLNAIGHLVDTGHVVPGPGLVIAVSAVPPLAAALAVHLAASVITAVPAAATVDTPAAVAAEPAPEVSTPEPAPAPAVVPAEPAPAPEPLVICGGHEVYTPAVPPRPRLSTDEATAAIEGAWHEGLSIREAARVATRSPAYVQRVYTRLEADAGPQPVPGQLALEGAAA